MSDEKNEQSSKGRVLVVDDEAPVCEMLSEFLSPQGFESRSSYSGNSALQMLKQEPFDVVISDVRMPGISGIALLEEACKSYPQTAFLMATAVDDVNVAVQALQLGAYDYLMKPLQLPAVLCSIQRAIESKHLEMDLEKHRRNLEHLVDQRTKQLQAAMKRIELNYDETLEALGAALDLRDSDTEGHSCRVSHYCLVIGRAMGLSDEALKHLERGAYLHDIGKIGIPDSILLKPGKLTPEEIAIMETHARIGYELLCRILFLAPAAEIVLTHQERFDGTGYPQGLVGSEIPLGARIFAVADTLDAMTSDRSYRRALPFSSAHAEIIRESGRQFDPEVVKAFLSVPKEVWARIQSNVSSSSRSVCSTSSCAAIDELLARDKHGQN